MDFEKIIDIIAQKNNTTKKVVLEEMQKSIDNAFSSPDPRVRAEWAKIPCKGKKPTPEEFILYQTSQIYASFNDKK